LLHQDTQASGVASASPPAVALSDDDDPAAVAHTLVADASGAPESTGKQPSTGIGLASSGRMPRPFIPTLRSAGRYVMDMKRVTDREPSAGRAAVAANHGWQPGSCRR
jgi:hypothetical protein